MARRRRQGRCHPTLDGRADATRVERVHRPRRVGGDTVLGALRTRRRTRADLTERAARLDRVGSRRPRHRRRFEQRGDDGRRARPATRHRWRVRLPVLLERAAVGASTRPRRRDDHVPQPRRARRCATARSATRLRTGGDDLPRPPGPSADEAQASARRGVRHDRPLRRDPVPWLSASHPIASTRRGPATSVRSSSASSSTRATRSS